MATLTADEFKEAIDRYLTTNKMTIAALAQRLGKGETTVGDWRRGGIKSDEGRQQIIAAHPWLFEPGAETPAPPTRASGKNGTHDTLVLIKTEQARLELLALRSLLIWFLFDASADERHQFRDNLGDEWKHFLELTRAMTNETAFGMANTEGRLEWCKS